MEESQSFAAVLRDVLAEDRTLLGRRAELLAALDARADDVDFLTYSAFQQAIHDSTVGERLLAADALDDNARRTACMEARAELRAHGMQERAIGSVVQTIVAALGWRLDTLPKTAEPQADEQITDLKAQLAAMQSAMREMQALQAVQAKAQAEATERLAQVTADAEARIAQAKADAQAEADRRIQQEKERAERRIEQAKGQAEAKANQRVALADAKAAAAEHHVQENIEAAEHLARMRPQQEETASSQENQTWKLSAKQREYMEACRRDYNAIREKVSYLLGKSPFHPRYGIIPLDYQDWEVHPIVLEEVKGRRLEKSIRNAPYWAAPLGDDLYAIFLNKAGVVYAKDCINEELFESDCKANKLYGYMQILRPALFRKTDDTWTIVEKGAVELLTEEPWRA